MRPSIITAFIVVSALGACASSPQYREAPHSGAPGYSETRIESQRYNVSYQSRSADTENTRTLALRRAAELTLENGFDTFELVDQSIDRERIRRDSDSWVTNERVVTRDCGLLGCTTNVRNQPTFDSSVDH
ncbi:MAG: hypothetical protein CME88_02085 [Hirschia sp.]|nr:hypothetical protein [Hirschia sp.]MBF17152.1 hypothetical protein [Hirschia sp.]|tara:strand:- start:132 stop:524 length:393 start_codon:yes stop_codon:yes gene_type:complete